MRRLAVWLVLLSLMLAGWPVHAQDCASLTFKRGDVLVVNPGEAQNVRKQPQIDVPVLQAVPAGEYLTVWGGPTCADGYTWWQVEYDRQTGWTAESPADGGTAWLSKVDMHTLEQDSLHIEYEPSLFSGLEVNDYDWQAHIANYIPPSRDYQLLDYLISTEDRPEYLRARAHIVIYPRGEQEDAEMNLDGRYKRLHEAALIPDALLTFLPFEEEVYRAPKFAYLHFNGGLGPRAVTYFEQTLQLGPGDYTPIRPYYGYSFSGFTDDGAYYIDSYFPLEVDVTLPPFPTIPTPTYPNGIQNFEDSNRVYNEYSQQARRLVDDLPPEAFTPRLALLDALIRSLAITEPIELHFNQP